VLAGLVAGAAVAWYTAPGPAVLRLQPGVGGRNQEGRLADSRKETMQTTGIVFAFVVAMAIFLWLTDKSLEWVLYDLILGWKK
jgi:preprotein translocase subunit SecE